MEKKYVYPAKVIKDIALSKLKKEGQNFINKCFEDETEPNLQTYYEEQYGYSSPYKIADVVTENEKTDFDVRFEEQLKNLDKTEYFWDYHSMISANCVPCIKVPSLTYILDDEKVYYDTALSGIALSNLTKQLLSIKNIERKFNKNVKIVIVADCSGSMGSFEKNCIKTFVFWFKNAINYFYNEVEFRYVLHWTEAHEVSENDFYTQRESGGSICSSGLIEAQKIIDEVDTGEVDKFVFYFSDGDNLTSDNDKVALIINSMSNKVNEIRYIEINQYRCSSTILDVLKNVKNFKLYKHAIESLIDIKRALQSFFLQCYFDSCTNKENYTKVRITSVFGEPAYVVLKVGKKSEQS